MKNFVEDFYKILTLLKQHKPFAFNRFSDGELFILQNKKLILDDNLVQVEEKVYGHSYTKEDFKKFEPGNKEDDLCRERLINAFKFEKDHYFKGISCRCCTTEEDFNWQIELLGDDSYSYLTWANLLVNGNYARFIEEMYPIFNEYKTVVICNENANLLTMPFIKKDFRVGYNAMINDYSKIEEIKKWILDNNIEGYLFLFSASSFSKIAIHQLYESCDKNTYMDIGTSLNAFMSMKVDRGYLKEYWLSQPQHGDLNRVCIW